MQSTSSESNTGTTSSQKTGAPNHQKIKSGLTGWSKTVDVYFKQHMAIDCGRPEHFIKVAENLHKIANYRPGDKVPKRAASKDILSLMEPFKKASCPCERAACVEAWKWNAPGCLQTEFVLNGYYHKGVGTFDNNAPPKRVMCVAFRLPPAAFAMVHKRFPDWLFIQTGNGGHDHPVSHVTSQVIYYEVLVKLVKGSYLELHGNPKATQAFTSFKEGVHVDTCVGLKSDKDYVRLRTKFGPATKSGGKGKEPITLWTELHDIRDIAATGLSDKRQGFLSFHTGYYYTMPEISGVFERSPDAVMTMVMHRFEGQDGTFNNGELSWVKDTDGNIRQTNVKTGESYSHPDNSIWFKQTSWADRPVHLGLTPTRPARHHCTQVTNEAGWRVEKACDNPKHDTFESNPDYHACSSLAWTVNQATDDVYIITVVTCPVRATAFATATRPAQLNALEQVKQDGFVTISVADDDVLTIPIKSEHAAVFDTCRRKMVNKQRTEAKFAAHINTVDQKCQELLANERIVVTSDEMFRIQIASFWVDLGRDSTVTGSLSTGLDWIVKQHSLALQGKDLTKFGNKATLILDILATALHAKGGKDSALRVVECLRMVSGKVL